MNRVQIDLIGSSVFQLEQSSDSIEHRVMRGKRVWPLLITFSLSCSNSFLAEFIRCLESTNNDMQSCGYYLEALKACQAAARPY